MAAALVEAPDPTWSVQHVAEWFKRQGHARMAQKIDREGLALLSVQELKQCGIPHGRALKLQRCWQQRSGGGAAAPATVPAASAFRFAADLLRYAQLAPESQLAQEARVPRLALLGACSAGKTTIIARLSGLPLESATRGLLQGAQRQPVEYALIHDEFCTSPEIEVDGERVAEQELLELLARKSEAPCCGCAAVTVRVCSACATSLIVLDLPGLTAEFDEPTAAAVLERVRDPSVTPVAVLNTMDNTSADSVCRVLQEAGRSRREVVVLCTKADEGIAGGKGGGSEWLQLGAWGRAFFVGRSGLVTGSAGDWPTQRQWLQESDRQEAEMIHRCSQQLDGNALGLAGFREHAQHEQAGRLAAFTERVGASVKAALQRERGERADLERSLVKAEEEKLRHGLAAVCQERIRALRGNARRLHYGRALPEYLHALSSQPEELGQLPQHARYGPRARELLDMLSTPQAVHTVLAQKVELVECGLPSLERSFATILELCRHELERCLAHDFAVVAENVGAAPDEAFRHKAVRLFRRHCMHQLFHPMADVLCLCALQQARECLLATHTPYGNLEKLWEPLVSEHLKKATQRMNLSMHTHLEAQEHSPLKLAGSRDRAPATPTFPPPPGGLESPTYTEDGDEALAGSPRGQYSQPSDSSLVAHQYPAEGSHTWEAILSGWPPLAQVIRMCVHRPGKYPDPEPESTTQAQGGMELADGHDKTAILGAEGGADTPCMPFPEEPDRLQARTEVVSQFEGFKKMVESCPSRYVSQLEEALCDGVGELPGPVALHAQVESDDAMQGAQARVQLLERACQAWQEA